MAASFNVPLCLVLMVKRSSKENRSLLSLHEGSVGMIGILGMKIFSPLSDPDMMVASRTWESSCLAASQVPLQSIGVPEF